MGVGTLWSMTVVGFWAQWRMVHTMEHALEGVHTVVHGEKRTQWIMVHTKEHGTGGGAHISQSGAWCKVYTMENGAHDGA